MRAFVCDHCGLVATVAPALAGPMKWYHLITKTGDSLHACKVECAQAVAATRDPMERWEGPVGVEFGPRFSESKSYKVIGKLDTTGAVSEEQSTKENMLYVRLTVKEYGTLMSMMRWWNEAIDVPMLRNPERSDG